MGGEGCLSPIVLFVYNRPRHTQQTIEALQKNKLASESELFIYSDAAKKEHDHLKVGEVRGYIQTVGGFRIMGSASLILEKVESHMGMQPSWSIVIDVRKVSK